MFYLRYKTSLVLFTFRAQKVTSWNIRSFLRVSVSWNIRNFFGVFVSISRIRRKAFFWENVRNSLILELESFIFWKYNNFFLFFEFGLKKCARQLFLQNFSSKMFRNVLNYSFSSKYARVLPEIWESFISWKLEKLFLRKNKKLFQSRFFRK